MAEHRGRSDEGGDGMQEAVVKIYRCATVVRGGRRFSFAALVVVGDGRGNVGIGYGKANEVPPAVDKARKIARNSMVRVNLAASTIPHRAIGKYGSSKVALLPAGLGTGVIAGASVRAVLEMAGVHDVLTKAYGSTSPKNLVKATLHGLRQLRSRETIQSLRGVDIPTDEVQKRLVQHSARTAAAPQPVRPARREQAATGGGSAKAVAAPSAPAAESEQNPQDSSN
jgi:small subunit ribosomal protein S5